MERRKVLGTFLGILLYGAVLDVTLMVQGFGISQHTFDYDAESYSSPSPGYYETSEYLIGSVAFAVIPLESNGSIDPSTEDWNDGGASELGKVGSEINQALNWWSSQNPNASVSFRGHTRPDHAWRVHQPVPVSYEPINRPSTDEGLWISEAMTYLGFPGTDYYNQTVAYLNSLRSSFGPDWGSEANWAFVVFMVDSSNDADGRFANAAFSYAYLGGPFIVMTYTNNGYGPDDLDRTAAHEIGHIFYATDESDGTSEYSGYLNVADIENSGGVMYGYGAFGWYLSAGTWGQVGWRDTDGDGLQDIVDTFPDTVLDPYSPDPTTNPYLTCTGTVREVPYPNNNPYGTSIDVTINKITNVQFRVDGEPWQNATSNDGVFDEAEEDFAFTTSLLSAGAHTVEARGVNSVGNVETSYASDEVIVIGTDIAVTGLSLSRTIVGTGQSTLVNVTVLNQGSYTEIFDVTAYYGNATTAPEQRETFWSMGDVNRDGYINNTDRALIEDAFGFTPVDPEWCSWADLNQDLIVDGADAWIWVSNNGLDMWTYFISGAPIGTQTVLNLSNGTSTNITFTWNTIGIAEDNYTVSAYAVPIFWDEVDRADNGLSGGSVIITTQGDTNGDGQVNNQDLILLNQAYGSTPLSLNWNANSDINNDNKVDALDLYILGKNYGKTDS